MSETLKAVVAIVDLDEARHSTNGLNVTLDVLENPNTTAPNTVLVELTGARATVQRLLFEWGFTADEFPQYFNDAE
jgi:hypothetical protein